MINSDTLKRMLFNPWHILWISVAVSELFTALLNTIQYYIIPGFDYWRLILVGSIDALFVPLIAVPIAVYFIERTSELTKFNEQLQREIAVRKEAEEARKASEGLLHSVVESSADAIFVKDLQGRYVLMNRAGLGLMGRSPEEVRGRDDTALFPAAEAARLHDNDQRIISAAVSVMYEHALTIQGERKIFQVRKGPVLDDQGKVAGVYGISRDITERKQVEDALRSSETRFRMIIENDTSGIMVVDIETRRILYANPEIRRMLGYSEEELRLLLITDLVLPEEKEESLEAFQAHARGSTHISERVFRRKDGTSRRMSINSVHMELDSRRCLVGFFTDITEKHLLEEERLKTQRLEAVGMLAGGIAHDFNNLLQGVFGYISLAKLIKDDREKSMAALEEAEKALHLSVNLTNQLLTFSKGGKPVKKLIDLRQVIANAARFALSGSRCDYRFSSQDGLWHAEADEGQINQVIQNIVLNADQAMPEGGTVEIAARNVVAPGNNVPQGLRNGMYVEISIKDSGIGIPEQYLSKIFDLYFTTKEKGSGLGLATSYSIIRNHQGLIEVTSVMGKGTNFLVYLPATADTGQRAVEAELPAAALGLTGSILIMDDEKAICDLTGELIRRMGYTVEFARHGQEAIEKYEEAMVAGNPFSAVILDLTIRGGMGGAETLQKLTAIDPGIKAIVSSGYSDDSVLSHFQELGFKVFLKKPYTINDLRQSLKRVVGSSAEKIS
jgi:PAS domain S-box-containing protein